MAKVTSVLELGRYKPGAIAYWLTMRAMHENEIHLDKSDEWMVNHHPKVLHDRKKSQAWRKTYSVMQPPKLHALEYENFYLMLTCKLVAEPFEIVEVRRCLNTGEYFYINTEDEWMPESHLFDSIQAANRERKRIMRMVRKWAT